ncbi:MAG: hypothetical protein RR314_07825 [Oscillospiraceae bacterium]
MPNEQAREGCAFTCTSVTSQYADVSVPLKLKPYALVGKMTTECCGEPMFALRPCQGAGGSCGCEITITQTVCIRIPIEYGAEADVGDTTTACRRNSNCAGGAGFGCR